MKKFKKLLSVLLAIVMLMSCFTVLGSAAKTSYQTAENLEGLAAYSPYGQVTRLSIEERTSIIFDAVDGLLPGLNINMGEVFNVLGLSVTIDLTSIDRLCYSLDTIKSTFENGLAQLAMGIVNLGILESLETGKWVSGMTRDGTAQYTMLSTLLAFLSDNTNLVNELFTQGLDLGIVSLGDMSSIEKIILDLPSLVKGIVFPMLERWDDTLTEIQTLDTNSKGDGNVESTVNTFVKSLFSNNMSITTVKYDKDGNMTSEHEGMPMSTTKPGTPSATSPRCYYYITGTTPGSTMTVYHIVDAKEAEDLAKQVEAGTLKDRNDVVIETAPAVYTYFEEAQQYVMTEEVEGSGTYVWQATDDWGNKWSMKWYNDNSPFLPGFSGDMFDLTTMSASDLLYTFAPVVFEQMAPVVLNGSLKKILGGFFGAKYNYVGLVGSDAVNALAAENGNNVFFTQEQGDYLWEWSDYAVIDGKHFYRFEDQIFAADLSNVNNYFSIINWDYEVTGDFLDEFIPASDDDVNDRILLNLNDFLVKVANLALVESSTFTDIVGFESNWVRPALTSGDNSNIIPNIKAIAQAIISLAPQHIFGSDYATNERCYYNLLMSDDNDTVLVGIAAQIVDMVMPSMSLPGADEILASGAKVGAILAAVIREFAAYLVPEYNFDALIYTDFGTTTGDPVKSFVSGKDSSYWLDVIMTMALNVGFEYIRAFADLGEDTAAWTSFVSYSGYGVDGKTYAAGTTAAQLQTEWEGMLDYIVDWALTTDETVEWAWRFANLVEVDGLTIDLSTAQDPWAKLDKIIFGLIPFDEILTITTNDTYPTKLEKFLRYDLILGIVDLRWDELVNTIQLNGTNNYFRTANVLDQLAKLLKQIVNGIFDKLGGGSFAFIPSAITDFDSLANQANLVTTVKQLVGILNTALVTNGGIKTLFPFLNFFLGWKMDPQVIADPVLTYSFRDGNDYAFQWTGNGVYPTIDSEYTKLNIRNGSSGMIEKHRGTTTIDHEYDIYIDSVTSDATKNTVTFDFGDKDTPIAPGETREIKVGGTYSAEEAITVTIQYRYVGKDGNPVGGTQYTSYSFFLSNQYEDANVIGTYSGDEDDGNYCIYDWNKYVFTEDIYTSVTTYEPAAFGDGGTFSGTSNWHYTSAPGPITYDCDYNPTDTSAAVGMTGNAANYFSYYQNRDGGWAESFEKNGSTSGKLYYANSGVTADTDFPYGVYDMGRVDIKYSDAEKTWDPDFIYYNDYNIYDLYTENKDNGYTADMVDDVAVYNAYNTAWKNIVKLATYPMMTKQNGNSATDYVDVIMPQIEPAIEAFNEAKEAFDEASASASSSSGNDAANIPESVKALEAQLALDDNEGELEINFQDYEYYEYFNYADLRTSHRNFVKTYYAPEIMDTYYIEGSGIREAELNNVIAAEENSIIAAGIEATKEANDQAAIDASIVAYNEWQMPVNSDLLVEDMAARLAYYKTFVNDSVKEDADHLYFLNQEIAHIEAQQLNADDYTADSWAKFAEELADAKAFAAGTAEYATYNSQIYNAKYNLMVAYKNLLLKADSLIEAGGTKELAANAAIAEEIFTSLEAADGAWVVKEGVNAEEAYGALIKALGYYYVGEDGNTWNLYADSAIEYLDNDRPNRSSNQAKVNTANNNLVAALANFEATAKDPNTLTFREDAPYEGFIDTTNCGDYTGTVYGIDTLGQDDDMSADGMLADFLTTAYGDEYLEIVEADGGETTGTLINVLDEEGNAVETYVFIYFGDVDSDGMITSTDAMYPEYYEFMMEGIDTFAQFMASDIDGDGMLSSTDAMYAEYYEFMMEGMLTQYEIGEMAINNFYELI